MNTQLTAQIEALSGADKVGLKLAMAMQVLTEAGVEQEDAFRRAWAYAVPSIDFDTFAADILQDIQAAR